MFSVLIVSMLAGEPLFRPTGKYAPVIVEPAKPATPTKPEQSDLHSHLCSNPRCNHEWWHDPRKGPVSHNCPKCDREQYVINRTAPTGARSTSPPAASLQQVDRAPDTRATVYVVGATWCGACVAFKKKHGYGTADVKYIYIYIDKSRPNDVDVATWNEIVKSNNSGRFLYPFFMVLQPDGKLNAGQG